MKILFLGKLLNSKEPISTNLFKIFGLNNSSILFILNKFGIQPNMQLGKLSTLKIRELELLIKKNYDVNETNKVKNKNILNLIYDTNSIRAIRHKLRLPVNGQRTHTNAKTNKK